MRIRKDKIANRFIVEGLTEGQLAYIAALVGGANSDVDKDGGFKKKPIVSDAKALYQPLYEATKRHGLNGLVSEIEDAQENWRDTP